MLYGFELWCLLLVIGYVLAAPESRYRTLRGAVLLLGACAAAGVRRDLDDGRAHIARRARRGAQHPSVMHAYAFMSSFIMALLFFAHLQRSHAHEEAAARLAAAQTAQREARRRLVHARLQAVQARIDPQLLFDMLDAVRRSYEVIRRAPSGCSTN